MSELEGYVKFTVKEILERQDREAEKRHAELTRDILDMKRDLGDVKRRVASLEAARMQRAGQAQIISKAWIAVVAVLGIIVNIPAAIYYIHTP